MLVTLVRMAPTQGCCSSNASGPMLVTPFGITTDSRLLQKMNAASPMLVTLSGITNRSETCTPVERKVADAGHVGGISMLTAPAQGRQ